MKFMEAIFTQEGPGVVVARGTDGGLLVEMNATEMVVEVGGKQVVRSRPGPCVMMRHCQQHGTWFSEGCVLCKMEKRTDDAGD